MLSQNNFLFNDIALLPSIGTNRRAFYLRLMGDRIVDVLWHFPINIQTRRLIDSFTSQHVDRLVTFKAEILGHAPSKRYGKPYRISAINNTGQMVELLFFHGRAPYLNRIAKTGSTVVISGKLSFQKFLGADQWKFIHPDYIGPLSELNDWTGTERMYPLTAGLNQGMVRSVIKTTLERLSSMPNGFRDMDSKIRSKHWSVDTYMKRGASAIFESHILKDEGYKLLSFAEWKISLQQINTQPGPNYTARQAILNIYDSKQDLITVLKPERRYFTAAKVIHTEVAFYSTWLSHLYVVLLNDDKEPYTIQIEYKPLINLLGLGILMMVMGGGLAVVRRKY